MGPVCFHALTDDKFPEFETQLEAWKKTDFSDGKYHVLLYHRADRFDQVKGLGFDLVLSGHVHGGQWRIGSFGLLGPRHTFFPIYTSGRYEQDGTVLIVSRGLGDRIWVPRIRNMWHLPVIDFV